MLVILSVSPRLKLALWATKAALKAMMAEAFDATWRFPRVPPRLRRCEGGDIGAPAFVPPPETDLLGYEASPQGYETNPQGYDGGAFDASGFIYAAGLTSAV